MNIASHTQLAAQLIAAGRPCGTSREPCPAVNAGAHSKMPIKAFSSDENLGLQQHSRTSRRPRWPSTNSNRLAQAEAVTS